MGKECIAHTCELCKKAFKTRKSAKEHVSRLHYSKINIKIGPGQHVSYLWLDLGKWKPTKQGGEDE